MTEKKTNNKKPTRMIPGGLPWKGFVTVRSGEFTSGGPVEFHAAYVVIDSGDCRCQSVLQLRQLGRCAVGIIIHEKLERGDDQIIDRHTDQQILLDEEIENFILDPDRARINHAVGMARRHYLNAG